MAGARPGRHAETLPSAIVARLRRRFALLGRRLTLAWVVLPAVVGVGLAAFPGEILRHESAETRLATVLGTDRAVAVRATSVVALGYASGCRLGIVKVTFTTTEGRVVTARLQGVAREPGDCKEFVPDRRSRYHPGVALLYDRENPTAVMAAADRPDQLGVPLTPLRVLAACFVLAGAAGTGFLSLAWTLGRRVARREDGEPASPDR